MIARRLAAAIALALLGGLVGHHPAQAADAIASVNGEGITSEQFEDVTASLSAAELADFIPDPVSQSMTGDAGRFLLTLLLTNAAGEQLLTSLGEAPVTEAEIEEAIVASNEPALQNLTGVGRETVGTYFATPPRMARLEPDVDSLADQYQTSPASLGAYCATALIVDDRDDADAIIDEYGAAEDASWEGVAATAGAAVSDWQCTPLSTVADGALLADLGAAQPGDAVGPIQTADGYVVLVIDEFDEAAPKLENLFARLAAEGQTSAGAVLFDGFLLTADVTVDPRFGRWDPTSRSVVPLSA